MLQVEDKKFIKDEEFEINRTIYIECIKKSIFPWEPLYYYYMLHTDRIDIMSIEEFKEFCLIENYKYSTEQERYEKVSLPLYEVLDSYYEPQIITTKDGNSIIT